MNDFFVSFPDSNSSAIYHSKCCSTNKFAISYGENNLAKIDGNTAHDDGGEQLEIRECNKVLIQIFTKPIFDEDTFFLEILERRGAKGFGAGNITALAKSIILQQAKEELNN